MYVHTDSPEARFNGRIQAKKDFTSPWVRLTGPAVDEASMEQINSGNVLEKWLPRDPQNPAELAVATGVVVAFPVSNGTEKPDWKLIPGPADSRLTELTLPQAVSVSQAA